MTFIDLEKAYDSVPRADVITAMQRMNVQVKISFADLQGHKARVKIGNKLIKYFKPTKGIQQGYILPPLIFSIYMEQALETWYRRCSDLSIFIEDETLHSLLFADDQIIFAQNKQNMEDMIREL